jgi:GAF domain-containing protein
MTHLNATFLALTTDGTTAIGGIAENGDVSVHGGALSLRAIANLVSREVAECIEADRPLIVVIGKNKTRATAGEKFLELFALDIVRASLGKLSTTFIVGIAGRPVTIENSYLHPRVASSPLPWATKGTSLTVRMNSLLVELSTGDEGLALIPKGRTHVGD